MSSVQGLPSLHWLLLVHSGVPLQLPPEQLSLVVHGFSSLHGFELFGFSQHP